MRLLSLDASTCGRDRAALARVIESAQADVACLHHGPQLLRWRSITAAVGRRSGLVVVGGGRAAGANVLLSALGVDDLGSTDLALDGGSWQDPAGAVLGRLRLHGSEFVLGSATLVGNAAARLGQARALRDAVEGLVPGAPPAILSALGVDRPGTSSWQTLLPGRIAVAGRIFVDDRITVREVAELPGHAGGRIPPVVVDLALPTTH